jgi:diguanylate cyclase (GGDEF)-like protein
MNLFGIMLMLFLLLTRIENNETKRLEHRLFSLMIWITIVSSASELVTFVIDGKTFPFCKAASYFFNTLDIVGSCAMAYVWCVYVYNRIRKSRKRTMHAATFLSLPLAVNVILNLVNLTGCGTTFTISAENSYSRGSCYLLLTAILFFYYIYSIVIVFYYKQKGLQIKFFPIFYFIVPCMLGTAIQGMFYGISLGWASAAAALLFVYVQLQSKTVYEDSLSGLYNRRYMEYILSKSKPKPGYDIYGIMLDANDFKQINDVYGHNMGDDAIRRIGEILTECAPDNSAAIRYAGDEFVILFYGENDESAESMMKAVKENTEAFNNTHSAPYTLSLSMGYSKYEEESENAEKFFAEMDARMYEAKTEHYKEHGRDRRGSGRKAELLATPNREAD